MRRMDAAYWYRCRPFRGQRQAPFQVLEVGQSLRADGAELERHADPVPLLHRTGRRHDFLLVFYSDLLGNLSLYLSAVKNHHKCQKNKVQKEIRTALPSGRSAA